jgi:hypothetical protein
VKAICAVLLVLGFTVSTARADAPPTFSEWRATCEKLMALTSALKLPTVRHLETVIDTVKGLRDGVVKMQAHVASMTPDDQQAAKGFAARVAKWTDTEEAAVAAEADGRPIVTSLCDATIHLASLKADLARERANPSGVVNLSELNRIGAEMQGVEEQIKGLTPGYVAFRHHAFTGWESEAACVAAREEPPSP